MWVVVRVPGVDCSEIIEGELHSVNQFYRMTRHSVNSNVSLWICHLESVGRFDKCVGESFDAVQFLDNQHLGLN